MQVLGVGQQSATAVTNCRLHRIKGLPMTRQHRKFEYFMQAVRKRLLRVGQAVVARLRRPDSPQRHSIGGQRTGLVDAQHGRCTQELDRRDTPGQHLFASQTPGAQTEKQGEHHRQFLGQQGHGKGQPGKQAVEPVAGQQAIGQCQRSGKCHADGSHPLDDHAGLTLNRRTQRLECGQ